MSENTTSEYQQISEDTLFPYTAAKLTVYSLILILTLTGNLLSICILYGSKFERPSVKFIYGLLLKNIVLGGIALILTVSITAKESLIDNTTWTRILTTAFITYILQSAWSVLLISFDRYIAIRKALQYNNLFTNRMCFSLIAVTMIISCLLAACSQLLHMYDVNSVQSLGLHTYIVTEHDTISNFTTSDAIECKIYNTVIVTLGFILPLTANCLIYGSIYVATRNTTALARRNSIPPNIGQSSNHVTAKQAAVDEENSDKAMDKADESQQQLLKPPTPCVNGLRRLSGQLRVHKDNRKAAKMGALVIVEQLLIWLPFYILFVLQTFGVIHKTKWDWLVIACSFCDGITTPIVYVLRSKSSKAMVLLKLGLSQKSFQMHLSTLVTQSTFLRTNGSSHSQHSDENAL